MTWTAWRCMTTSGPEASATRAGRAQLLAESESYIQK
jgi:hypothetical protein